MVKYIKYTTEVATDWNQAIENTMLKMTAVLTLWLLFDKIGPQ